MVALRRWLRRVGIGSALLIGMFIGWTANIIIAFAQSKAVDKALLNRPIRATED